MANFDVLYPLAEPLTTIEVGGSFVVKGYADDPHECPMCDSLTCWTDGILMMYVCSEECNRLAWSEYYRELGRNA